jgi:DNA polymerase-3 subunit delta'
MAAGDGPRLRAASERFARAALAGTMAEGPWRELLKRARAEGEAACAELQVGLDAELELLAKRDRRRRETDHSERLRRLKRRVETESLDLALGLVTLWFRDLLCVVAGVPELACHYDRPDELAADAEGREPAALREAIEAVEDTRARLALNVTEELACEALGYRLERLLSA